MKRRDFLLTAGLAAGDLGIGCSQVTPLVAADAAASIIWRRDGDSQLFSAVSCDGKRLSPHHDMGLLDATCRLWTSATVQPARLDPSRASASCGPLRIELTHRLDRSGTVLGEDLLCAVLSIRNDSDQPQQVELTFVSSVDPSPSTLEQQVYLPLSAAGLTRDKRFASLGVESFIADCNVQVGQDEFKCHYLEPMASLPNELVTKALLLVPVIDVSHPSQPWRVALFTASDEPIRFRRAIDEHGRRLWHAERVVTVAAGQTLEQRCWLMVHRGDASVAWNAFHKFAHDDPYRPIEWVRDFRVHYYDFLSSTDGKNGHRGDGYDAALPLFRSFHVGLATQHGYYPCMGDHIRPQRKTWLAMKADRQGPVEMSIKKIKERIIATRAAGAKAGIYMHLAALDDSSEIFDAELAAARRIDFKGHPVPFGWRGPDVAGNLWWMSTSAPQWREQLLQQARWIMEILQPDAICMDETFTGIGYDDAPQRRGPISPHAIGFFKDLHSLVRSFGDDKAFFTSDCSMSGFSLWADGDVGDHAYPRLLGNPLYRQPPVRYLAVLGDKPWRPCAWHFRHMWEHQMALARQVGAGVGVSNGWIEYTGLHGLSSEQREQIIRDIESLL